MCKLIFISSWRNATTTNCTEKEHAWEWENEDVGQDTLLHKDKNGSDCFKQMSMQGLLSYYKPSFLRCGFMRKYIYIYILLLSLRDREPGGRHRKKPIKLPNLLLALFPAVAKGYRCSKAVLRQLRHMFYACYHVGAS